jgi:DNA-binding MarR family transcriptional regulator
MGTDPSHSADEAVLIMQYLKVMIERIFAPVAQEVIEHRRDLATGPGSGLHPGVNPNTIGRAATILRSHQSLTMSELSAALSVPLSTTTRMVDWFVATEQAVRLPDPDDRRVVRVALTEKGRQLHEFIETQLAQRAQGTLKCLTEEERSTLAALLRKLTSSEDDTFPGSSNGANAEGANIT